MNPEERFAQLTQELEAVTGQAREALKSVEEDRSKTAEVKALLENDLQPKIETLTQERQDAQREAEFKALQSDFSSLQSVIEDLRKGPELPGLEGELGGKGLEESDPYAKGGSVFADIRLANKGDSDARERLIEGYDEKAINAEGKALTEGVAAQGGYLVRPQVERQIVEAKEQDNKLRGLVSKINVNTNSIQLDQIALSTVAGWVAELAQKPETTGLTLATVTASVFTAAGLATVSNQLLQDSNPAVDGLVTSDLTKRLVALEETAFLQGSGVNQPLGILNTPGIGATALTSTAVVDLLNAVLDAIAQVETDHGAPNAILMHPRTWTRILKAQNAGGVYYIAPDNGVQDPRTGQRGPVKTLWGYPVVTSNRIPTNLGAGTNESRVIVGDFKECLILDRQGITVDESIHVHFTTNQTVFRAEERVGFTAARTPAAINVVGGAGLANG